MFSPPRLSDMPLLPAALAFIALTMLAAMPAAAQTPATTIEDADGTRLLQLNEDGGFAVFGGFGAGAIPVEGTGTRLMWYPAKAAFRAGRVNDASWDDANVGNYSVAMSLGATASGDGSTALGISSTASGDKAVAIGHGTNASGERSTSLGFATTASGLNSTAMGHGAFASGESSTAAGYQTTAATDYSTSIGILNQANDTDDGTLFVVGNGDPFWLTSSDALVLNDAGNLWIAGTLTEASDRRLKTAIAPLEGGVLEKLAKVHAVRYRFRAGTGHPTEPQIGLLAQEVRAPFPELVSEGSDGYLSLSYSKFTAVLLKGLQEQQRQLEAHQVQLEMQQEVIETLQQHRGAAAGLGAVPMWLVGITLVGGLLLWHRRAT